jgi:beta-mannosidase
MNIISLNGEWKLSGGNFSGIKAKVPGCVHTDLLDLGKIPDPYYRDNEKQLMWIGETDWEYTRSFEIGKDMLKNEHVVLLCEGLDTLADIKINGSTVAKTDNMFRTWEFDVKHLLRVGQNEIFVFFKSTFPYAREKNNERWLWQTGIGHHRLEGSNYVRKMQCNYGWDWGPKCVTCGIWRDIKIQGYDNVKISNVYVKQKHIDNAVELEFCLNLDNEPVKGLLSNISLTSPEGKVTAIECDINSKTNAVKAKIEAPELWWPNSMGEQYMYGVKVELIDGRINNHKAVMDLKEFKIGLRTLELDRHPDKWGESFGFKVNGIPFFAKGANWIPADTFVTRTKPEFYEQLIQDMVKANMNFIRVWGGGIYEYDIFYELCDKYGICVWQDFMFACAAYPVYDKEFMENVKQEAVDNVIRLRNHPCMALWCGNNEMEQITPCINNDGSDGAMSWDEYKQLFDKLLPEVVREYCPHVAYWPSSPHTPGENRLDVHDSTAGDAHLWEVWHGRKPFEWYRTCAHRFNSEFGFQSFPEPAVVEEYTLHGDRNVASYIMEHHQRSGIGNDAIIQYMLSWYRLPSSFDMLLWLSQILQGMAMKYAVEHWRRSMPRGMGTLYWQLNDCWPVASWSSIDYKGNWKALHYMARSFYAPILVSGVEDIGKGTVEIHITNDTLSAVKGKLEWRMFDVEGSILSQDRFEAEAGPNASTLVKTVDVSEILKEKGIRNSIMYIEFKTCDGIISDDLVFFSRPKHMELMNPDIKTSVTTAGTNKCSISMECEHPALWVWPEIKGVQAKYSDRFFHIMPGTVKTIAVEMADGTELEQIKENLVINSLYDTYQ